MAKAKAEMIEPMPKGKTKMDMATATKIVDERERIGLGSATVERIHKAGQGEGRGFERHAGETGTQRVNQAPLDRLHAAGAITGREFEAGDRYRLDAFLARVDPAAPTVDWSSVGGNFGPRSPSIFSSQAIFDARQRYRRTAAAFGKASVVRTVLDLAVIREHSLEEIGRSVFGRHRSRDAAVAGNTGLRVALGALADVYGL